jgi:hypothetical protein
VWSLLLMAIIEKQTRKVSAYDYDNSNDSQRCEAMSTSAKPIGQVDDNSDLSLSIIYCLRLTSAGARYPSRQQANHFERQNAHAFTMRFTSIKVIRCP